MFSVSYFLARYIFTPKGAAAIVAAILAIWALNSLEPTRSEDDVLVLVWIILALIYLAFAAIVGAIIDGKRGALWGCFLGPIGWIIAAIGKLEHRDRSKVLKTSVLRDHVASAEKAVTDAQGYNVKKWGLLKEVDPEIKAASDLVVAVDPSLDAVLAEKYLVLSEKQYLQPLVENLLAQVPEKKKEPESIDHDPSSGVFETSGPFKFRILSDQSVTVFSGPSGDFEDFDHFQTIEDFLATYHGQGARFEAIKKID